MGRRFATLDPRSYAKALRELTSADPRLARILEQRGTPPFWTHPPGFPGLVIGILGQQVSLESADAVFAKLTSAIGVVAPERFLPLEDSALREMGFSRQKAAYVRGVARAIVDGVIDLDALATRDDHEARAELIALKGIGPWTADVYLLFALRRADAWPSGDLALIKAIHEVRVTRSPIGSARADEIAERWRPWRGVAARILWHHYLSARGRSAGSTG